VDAAAGRNLFYWFVESRGSPSEDPLVLWLNGGPGCSSLGGMFSELGPFFTDPANEGQTVVNNPYSWVNVANVIFLESPAGVGFSYSDTPSDYVVGDLRTSQDIFAALTAFVARYPSYAGRPLFITGESYGGHYVPSATAFIVKQTLAGVNNPTTQVNISGFAVGNAWTNAELDNIGAVDFWLSHGMVSTAAADGILSTCNMSDVGPLAAKVFSLTDAVPTGALGFVALTDSAPSCNDWQNQAFAEMGNVNIYDIYVDVCPAGSSPRPREAAVSALSALPDSNSAAGCMLNYDPCSDSRIQTYLNRAEVKAAIHANASIAWTDCSNIITYSRYDLLTSMLPVYEYLLTNWPQGRYQVYSGDVDAIVPITGTRAWLAKLGLPFSAVDGAWRSYTVDNQVGGWTQAYDGPNASRLTFASVRNAGHFVPEMQGSRALYMITQFLAGAKL
jgi:serine carboxypeptidase-like clade 2